MAVVVVSCAVVVDHCRVDGKCQDEVWDLNPILIDLDIEDGRDIAIDLSQILFSLMDTRSFFGACVQEA